MNERTRFFGLALATLLGLLVAVPVSAAEQVTDSSITSWVNEGLRRDPLVKASQVSVSTEDGIVTLSGSLDSLAARDRADLEAKKIRGVRGVVNEISVAPSPRPDADIVSDVRRRILNDAVIESEGIRVTSVNGEVTLGGDVATWSEAQQAALLASEVRGVKKVENEIVPKYTTQRSDQEIKNDAIAALDRDVYLVDLPITVAVQDAVITLTGSVGSPFEKDRAARDVRWVSHVRSVSDQLEVKPWENLGARKKAPDPSDHALARAIRDELEQDQRVDATKIDVRVSYGMTNLEGSVPNHVQKRIAERDARDVVGVRWVANELFARADRRDDWAIRDDIELDLRSDSELWKLALEANVNDGVVTLTGTVPDWYERTRAADVAGHVRGVRKIVNEIRVDRGTQTSRAHSNAAVADAIRSSFKWHWKTHWIAGQIDVTVNDGVATLSGDVDSWAQRREAAQVAFDTEGVWKVVNRLSVAGYGYDWGDWDYAEPYGIYH